MRVMELFLLTVLFALLSFITSPSFGASSAGETNAEFQLNRGENFARNALGTRVVRDSVHLLRVQYDFSIMGGAIGTMNLRYAPSPGVQNAASSAKLPKNALVVGCYIDVITAPTSASSPTIGLGTGQTGVDLKAATAIASYTGVVACIPTGSAASAIKLTADSTPSMVIAAATLTAGKFNVDIEYILSDP